MQNYTPQTGKGAAFARDPINIILPRLEGYGLRRRGPDKWVFRCPVHDDRTASAGLREMPDGAILIHCFAGCSVESIVSAIGLTLADLFPPRINFDPEKPKPKPPRFTASDLIRTAAFESGIVSFCAADILAGKPVPESDLARMAQAIETLSAIHLEVNHGHC
ncbi:hypothetical protein [Methylomagnum sp.]